MAAARRGAETGEVPSLSWFVPVLVDAAQDCHASRQDLERVLAADFGIDHTTLQVDHRDEHGDPADLGAALHVSPLRVSGDHAGHGRPLHVSGDHEHAGPC